MKNLQNMTLPGAKALSHCGAPGPISLEKVSTGEWISGVRFLISAGLCDPINSKQEWLPDPTRVQAYLGFNLQVPVSLVIYRIYWFIR